MLHHRAYGLAVTALDVVVVDDAKPMQSILRSILVNAHVARVRTYDSAEAAMQAMIVEPPHLLITDWHMQPTDGLTLVRSMRRRRMGQVALIPAIMITAHPTRALVEDALRSGTHFVIAKPVSPATLMKRIDYVLKDARGFELLNDEKTVVLQGQTDRSGTYRRAETYMRHAQRLDAIAGDYRDTNGLTTAPTAPASAVPEISVNLADLKPTMRDLEATNTGLKDQMGRLGGFAPVGGRRAAAKSAPATTVAGAPPGQPPRAGA